ncbi:hypothetical protein Cgig2_009993 [Carnegiea gigantea]|uniref:Protein EMBRYONIC FLOWER 1-like n=1 Tax=Carnegiea gigantea TaxID=171969 RepID=A0A9Q1Q8R9_9CARY|nr:hypothetical protein Cgig2_009993 [Carnegiea gigantea]
MAGTAVVELNQQSDSSLVTKSTRQHQLTINDSIAVDNNPSCVKHAAKCNHFSIRGYVSEIRKRDPKLCNPFAPYGSHGDFIEPNHELPPMEVPNFRWWQCGGCVPEAAGVSSGTGKEGEKPAHKADGGMQNGQASKVDAPTGRNSEASTSTDSNDNRNLVPTICADPKGKGKAHAEDELPPLTGHENGFLMDPSSQGTPQQNTNVAEARQSDNDEAALRLRCNENGLPESHHKDCRFDRVDRGAPEDVNREANIADENGVERTRDSSDAQCADALSNRMRTDKVAGIVDGSSSDGKGRLIALPDLNECDGEPPDDDDGDNDNDHEVFAPTGIILCEEDDDYLGADHRKTPKVRLLSDLLGLKENQNDAKVKKKNHSLATPPAGPATSKSMVSDSQGQSPMNDNAKRKRMGSQDEGTSKSMDVRGLINGNKKHKSLYEEISESDSEDKSAEMVSETLMKKRTKSTLGKNPLLEKKSKRMKVDNVGSAISRQRIIPKVSHDKERSSEKLVSADAVIGKAVQSGNSDRVTDLPQKSNVFPQTNERNSALTKKKVKTPQAAKEHPSVVPSKNHASRECSAIRNTKNVVQKNAENEQNQPSERGSTGKRSQHFPNSYFPLGKDQIRTSLVKGGFYPLPSQPESLFLDGGSLRRPSEDRNIGEGSAIFRAPITASFTGGRVDGNGERIISPTTNAKGKHVWIPEADEAGLPPLQPRVKQVPDSVAKQKGQATEVRGRDIDINSIPPDDKVPEQGPGDRDDIPMDIVELMAKNQYERNLSDPKDQHFPITVASYGKNVRSNGNGSVYGENMPIFGQSHFLSMQKPLPNDARNILANRFHDMGSSKQKMFGPFADYNCNHLSIRGDLRENAVSATSLSANQPQGQEHISPYSPLNFSANSWNGQMGTQRHPPSFLQAMESHTRFRGASPRPNVETRVWPPVMSNRMPVGITNPDMLSQSSSALNEGRAHHQPSSTILSFNLGKQNMSFSNGYNTSGHLESSVGGKQKGVGSVDLYSNEAISAMHLLSLMQTGATVQPPAPSSLDGKPELLKRSMVLPNQQYKHHSSTREAVPQKAGASSSRQPLLGNNGRTSLQGNNSCHPCYSAVPTAFPFSSSSPNTGGVGRNSGFISPIPLTSRGQRSIETPHFPTLGAQKPTSSDVSRKGQLAAALDKGKSIMSSTTLDEGRGIMSSATSLIPLQGPKDSHSPNCLFGLAARHDEGTVSPVSQKEICMVNRNPSEFNDLRELSKYMIGPEDLKPRGMAREKPGRPRGDAKKQENRTKKHIPTGKEHRKS